MVLSPLLIGDGFHPSTCLSELSFVLQEMKELRESVSKSYLEQLKEVQQLLEAKGKELVDSSRISAEQKHALEGLNERLSASEQSCVEANEIISR